MFIFIFPSWSFGLSCNIYSYCVVWWMQPINCCYSIYCGNGYKEIIFHISRKDDFVYFCLHNLGFMGNFYPGMKVNTIDLSPNYAGSLMALTNGLGALTGVAAPAFVGIMTPNVRITKQMHLHLKISWK